MKIILVGANGKMGQMVCKVAKENNLQIIAKVDKQNQKYTKLEQIPPKIIKNADMVLDFAMPEILDDELNFCLKHNKKLVICCTGHSIKQEQKIKLASKKIAIFKTANTSFGIALINEILKKYSKFLNGYKIAIIDKHHKNKKDSPSGTALAFSNTLNSNHLTCECLSLRAGTCVGEHQILLFNDFEEICITHIAESRELFAIGALKICKFVKDLSAGLYGMENFFIN